MNEQSASWRFHDRLIRKLETISTLTAKEKQAIRALPYIAREFPADQDIISIGSTAMECCVIIQGWACRYRTTLEGKRQIMAFHLPGDMPDQQSVYLRRMDHSIAALTPITVAFIHHRNVQELVERHDGIASAFWRDALVDAAIFREWLVNLGRRTAHQRVAHVLCEMATKARVVGLNDGDTYPWPVTQNELADALGLTDVHVNRVVADLKRDGLLTFKRGSFVAHDWERLKTLGQFDPLYLHLNSQAA